MGDLPQKQNVKHFSVHLEFGVLRDGFFLQMQQLLDVLTVALSSLDKIDDATYSGFSQFFSIHPASNKRLPFESACLEARRWYFRSTFRDAIDKMYVYIDKCSEVCAFIYLANKKEFPASEYDLIVNKGARRFHKLGLKEKLKALRNDFGIASEFEPHVLSLNAVRNCLVHRSGVVGQEDVDENQVLSVLWRSMNIVAHNPDTNQEIVMDSPLPVEKGWGFLIRESDHNRTFCKGEVVELTYQEVVQIFHTLTIRFANSTVKSIEAYARKSGVMTSNSQSPTGETRTE